MTTADDIQHHSLNNHCWKSKTHQNRNGSTFTYPLHTQTHTNTNTLCFFKFSSNLLKLSKPKTQPWKDIPWSLQQASCVFWHSSTYHDYNNSLVMMMMNSFCGMVDWRKAKVLFPVGTTARDLRLCKFTTSCEQVWNLHKTWVQA